MTEREKKTTRHGISELFIHRPITTTLVMVGIVLFGFIGYRALPVSDLPTVDYPTISVNASLPGANPETMAASVRPLWRGSFRESPALIPLTPPIRKVPLPLPCNSTSVATSMRPPKTFKQQSLLRFPSCRPRCPLHQVCAKLIRQTARLSSCP